MIEKSITFHANKIEADNTCSIRLGLRLRLGIGPFRPFRSVSVSSMAFLMLCTDPDCEAFLLLRISDKQTLPYNQ